MSKSASFGEFQLFDEANFLFDAFDPFKDTSRKDDEMLMSQVLLSHSRHGNRDPISAVPLIHVDTEDLASSSHRTHDSTSLSPPSRAADDLFGHPLVFSNLYNHPLNSSSSPSFSPHPNTSSYPATMHVPDAQLARGDYSTVHSSPIPMHSLGPLIVHAAPVPSRPVSALSLAQSRNLVPMADPTPGYQMILPACQPDFRIGSPAPSTTSSHKEPDNDSLLSRSPSLFSLGSPAPAFTGSISAQPLTKRDRDGIAAEKCRKKKQELITTLTLENEALQLKKIELEKSNQALEQRLDYLINVMASYGISIPPNKSNH